MKTYKYKLLFAALVHFVFVACKKDLTPTKSNLMIGSVNYDFKLNYPNGYSSFSNYTFTYSNDNILKAVGLAGEIKFGYFNLTYNRGYKNYTINYKGNDFVLDNLEGQGNIVYADNDQTIKFNNNGKIISSIHKEGFASISSGPTPSFVRNFEYENGNLKKIYSSGDSIVNFSYQNNNLVSFTKNVSTKYTLGYQNNTPDTSLIKVNGINNLILCIPFNVQETLPFLVVDDRLSLTGKKQNYLINSISVEEKFDDNTQITTTYSINYLYDLEGRITHVQWINNATLAIYREAVIGYL
jgi:hypothetical protein